MDDALAAKYENLKKYLRSLNSVVVAFSGGVDSSLVAYVTARQLGTRALAVTSGSKSLKRSDLTLATQLAEQWGMQHRVIVTDELSKPDYRANPTDRCFHCKTSLYDALTGIAREEGYDHVVSGTNRDDLNDHRPGLVAAGNFHIKAPLVETGFNKSDIRALAAHLGLRNADKPQAACLSSRFPYGTPIDESRLAQVEHAEDALYDLGFSQLRVRHHGDVARLELLPEEFPLAMANRDAIEAAVRSCGYRFVALDLRGFRSGSLNAGLVEVVNLP